MVVREIAPHEFMEFYKLFSEVMLEGYPNFPQELREYFLKKDYTYENLRTWYERKVRIIFGYFLENVLMGFLYGDYTYGGVGFISWLGVKKEFRGKGIGTELVKAYESFAKSKGAHLLELYTFETLKDYYQKFGFQEVGRREQGFYGQQNIIMDKKIGDWDMSSIKS